MAIDLIQTNYREMSSVQVVVLLNLILRLTEQKLATQLVKREYCKSPITRLFQFVKILQVLRGSTSSQKQYTQKATWSKQ